MIAERLRLGAIERAGCRSRAMSANLPLSAAAAEDANFCGHWGFDLEGIRAAMADSERVRGGSMIRQQVTKNVSSGRRGPGCARGWRSASPRLVEALWPKRRIMEVYLNVAEMGEGVFGAEAAARHYWKGAAPTRAAAGGGALAMMPDPRGLARLGITYVARRGAAIQKGAATIGGRRGACFLETRGIRRRDLTASLYESVD